MKNLVIVGARGFGRELYLAAKESVGYGEEFVIKGFLDSKSDALDEFRGYPCILSSPEEYELDEKDVFIVALGDPKWRKHYAELMEKRGANFISLIHRTASLGNTVKVGKGCYIAHNAILTADIQVGDHVCIFHGAMIGHDCVIGDYCHLSAQVFLGGGVRIGNGAVLHPGSRIVPHKRIGECAVVGIGSAVISNVKPNTTVFGVPATAL